MHRFLAGSLGVMVLAIALIAAWRRKMAVVVIVAAVFAAVGVVLYMRGAYVVSSILSALAIALPLLAAATLDRPGAWRVGIAALAVIIFQAMLGMWTVTLLVKPIVVTAHLLGGLATFALLAWAALRWVGVGVRDERFAALRMPIAIGIVVLVCQITLVVDEHQLRGCLRHGFPKCLGQWWPATDFHEAFILWRGIGVNYEGGVLDMAARSAIQMAHRIGAGVTFIYLAWLSHKLARAGLRKVSIAVAVGSRRAGAPWASATCTGPAAAGRNGAQWRGRAAAVHPACGIGQHAASSVGVPVTTKFKQYLELTKPRVVALLVFCAVIGMFLAVDSEGNRVLPTWQSGIFGTLGIWLASAPAAAFNHLIDQRIDKLDGAHLASAAGHGELTPMKVFVFAMTLGVISMLILVCLVNMLTAVLTFFSLIGYAVIYTAYLKRATPQNIVIGGIAGAARRRCWAGRR